MSPAPSGQNYFLVPALPAPGEFLLDGPEGRHASTVRRLRVGEQLVLCDGAGHLAVASVREIGRGTLLLTVGDGKYVAPPKVSVTVVQALPKGERSDLAVELATEAGADRIVPWQAHRCVARWTGNKLQRWQTVSRQSAKQSRRAYLPEVVEAVDTTGLCELVAAADLAMVLHEGAHRSLASVSLPDCGSLLLIVGPEGGIAAVELDQLHTAGAQPVLLGPQVLRTSTAAAVALGALGVLTGRWG